MDPGGGRSRNWVSPVVNPRESAWIKTSLGSLPPPPPTHQLLCSAVQKALFEEEEHVRTLSQKVRVLEKANGHLREKVKTMKRLLRQARRDKEQQSLSLKQLYGAERPPASQPAERQQDTGQDRKTPAVKRVLAKKIRD